jgi:hypothetical protein
MLKTILVAKTCDVLPLLIKGYTYVNSQCVTTDKSIEEIKNDMKIYSKYPYQISGENYYFENECD